MSARLFAAIAILFIAVSLTLPAPARADGIIIPEPPICERGPCPPPPCPGPFPCPIPPPMVQLDIRYHQVTVSIEDQVAVTHVDQVFYNPNEYTVEGTYVFPLPLDASVTSFTLWVDGQAVEGEVLDANQARQAYEEIVRSLRDPALLEYGGRGAVKASIFPISPGEERRIELEYSQALLADNGLVRYIYPLSTEKYSSQPLEKVSISVDIRTNMPIRAIYSPTHRVAIDRDGENQASAGYEDHNVLPDTDFALYYSLGESEAFHLLTYRDPSDEQDEDGFFLLLLAPRPEVDQQAVAKDLILVLDRSGSMEGEKFQQAQSALQFILQRLNPEDRFNVISFSTGLETFAAGLRPVNEAQEAVQWVQRQSAMGSTDINRALLEAAGMANRERPTFLIFLTDGLPTEGEVDSQKILDNLKAASNENLRLFAFGVGYDVDTFLLDSLAQDHHGSSTYVLPGEKLDETISAFYDRIGTPVLTNLLLDFGGRGVYDLFPNPLPDLFRGSQMVVVGRYRDPGTEDVTLEGMVNGEAQIFRFPRQLFMEESRGSEASLAMLPRLWATRKIGHLLNQLRLSGADQETIDQIVRLSIRYGIVTPYTSYLVTEPMPLGEVEQERISREQFRKIQSEASAAPYGQDAVEKAAGQGALAGAEAVSELPTEAGKTIRITGNRTFVYNNDSWVDTSFDPDEMKTVKVSFLSEDYFALAESRADLAAAFAMGQSVIAVVDGMAYQVVPEGTETGPVPIPATFTPWPGVDRATPTPENGDHLVTTPDRPTPSPAAGTLPCASGLLPLALVPLLVIWANYKQR